MGFFWDLLKSSVKWLIIFSVVLLLVFFLRAFGLPAFPARGAWIGLTIVVVACMFATVVLWKYWPEKLKAISGRVSAAGDRVDKFDVVVTLCLFPVAVALLAAFDIWLLYGLKDRLYNQ